LFAIPVVGISAIAVLVALHQAFPVDARGASTAINARYAIRAGSTEVLFARARGIKGLLRNFRWVHALPFEADLSLAALPVIGLFTLPGTNTLYTGGLIRALYMSVARGSENVGFRDLHAHISKVLAVARICFT